MYLITNRATKRERGGLDIFLSTPSPEGANNLRIAKITGRGSSTRAEMLPDELSARRLQQLERTYRLTLDPKETYYRSLEMACLLSDQARKEKKHILFYVHGYNNDVADIVASVRQMERQYPNLLVVPFSWPAKGGGALSGTANYLDDKRDARVSSGALDRVFEHIRSTHQLLVEAQNKELWEAAKRRHGANLEAARAAFAAAQARVCKVSINLMCHSMGCYVLKYATLPAAAKIRTVIFDNVCLVAADTNNHDHIAWVQEIEVKGGVYVVINEDDNALQWSRRKPGDEQRARLGHYLHGLNASNGVYVDITRASGVGAEHSYFKGKVVRDNAKLGRLFGKMFSGDRPERFSSQMTYAADINAYRLK